MNDNKHTVPKINNNVQSFSEQHNLLFKSSSNEFIGMQSENYGKLITKNIC